MQISFKKKCIIDIAYRNIFTGALSSFSTCSIRCTCVDVIQVTSFLCVWLQYSVFFIWLWTHIPEVGQSCYIYTQPRLGGKDFHCLVFTNKRTDWIAWHSGNSIQWHMYAHTHHHCGPVINLSSLVQLIWLKVTALAVSVELKIWPVCMDVQGVWTWIFIVSKPPAPK